MELTKEHLMAKLTEYRQAAEQYDRMAAANKGAAEAVAGLLQLLTTPEPETEPAKAKK